MEFTEENFRKLAAENQQLRQRIDWLVRQLFGRSSEKSHPNQLAFDLGENGVAPDAP
jgi:cell division septum initiation protein DivIVA